MVACFACTGAASTSFVFNALHSVRQQASRVGTSFDVHRQPCSQVWFMELNLAQIAPIGKDLGARSAVAPEPDVQLLR